MKGLVLVMTILIGVGAPGDSQRDQTSSKMLFTGTVSRKAKGSNKPARITISRLRLESNEDTWQSFAVANFSIMAVYSGRIETLIDGKTEIRDPGDYWSVKAGSVLRERALRESAILQVITIKR
jgi:hypothetical protein